MERRRWKIAGDAAAGLKAITAELDPANPKSAEVLANFKSRYDYISLPWYMGSAYDDVYIAAECLKQNWRRPGCRRIPGLPVRNHLERQHRL